MSKVEIKKSDIFRVLFTETLPYEIPFHLSNHKFYKFVSNKKNKDMISEVNSSKAYTIPLNFRIPKGRSSRLVSIVHPFKQADVVDFYKKYGSLIVHMCSKSSVSLRSPSKVASCFYEREGDVFEVAKPLFSPEATTVENELTDEVARTYFAYKEFSMLYQFYSSYMFKRLEKRFKYCTRIDISKCFHSIYTHSIAWAVGGKAESKDSTGYSNFENEFDKLMQKMNFGETNGIVVGPEVSRVFAEVILQDVDQKLLEEISKEDLVIGRDLNVKRYIDDFFIFSNSLDDADFVEEKLSSIIQFYKMYLNDSKKMVQERPFMSGISVAKIEIKRSIRSHFDSSESGIRIHTNKLMNEIKASISRNDVKFSDVSNFTISQIHKNIKIIISAIDRELTNDSDFELFVERMVDLIGTILCFGGSFRCLAVGVEMLLEIKQKIFRFYPSRHLKRKLEFFEKLVFDELNILLGVYANNPNSFHDLVSCLIAMKSLCGANTLSSDKIIDLLSTSSESGYDGVSLGAYARFSAGLLLSVDGKGEPLDRYKNLYDKVVSEGAEYLQRNALNMKDTESFMFFCDYMSCPYIDPKFRWQVYERVVKAWNKSRDDKIIEALKKEWRFKSKKVFKETVSDPSSWPQFVDWGVERNLLAVIRKKELPISY